MRLSCEPLEARETPAALTPQVPAELWKQLAADVRVLAEGTAKPDQALVNTLVATVQAATADKVVTAVEKAKVAQAASAVLASANVPKSEVQAVLADVQAIYTASVFKSVPAEMWKQLAADVKVLVEGTAKPDQAAVNALVAAVQSAAADKVMTSAEKDAIRAAAQAVLASANVPKSEVQAVLGDIQSIYAAVQV